MKSHGESVVRECQCDRAAGEEDERQRGARGVKPEGASDDELHLVVERLRAGVVNLTGGIGTSPRHRQPRRLLPVGARIGSPSPPFGSDPCLW